MMLMLPKMATSVKMAVLTALAVQMSAVAQDVRPTGKMINGGTPPGVPPTFDCKARVAAWEYGKYLLPERGDFRTLFEALQLQDCGLTTPAGMDDFKPPSFSAPPGAIYVDAASGSDSAAGTAAAPLKTIEAGVAKAKGSKATVVLKAGTYYTDTIQIGKEHSGLTIQNAAGEAVTVSGGVPLSLAASDWKADPLMKGRMVADLKGKGIDEITGLRLDGQRSIRAKYPNGNMELSGNWLSGAGASMGGGDYFKG